MTNDNKYLAIDAGGTEIKYCVLDKNAESIDIKEISSGDRKEETLYKSLDTIILPHLDQVEGIALSFTGPINVEEGIAITGGAFGWINNLNLKSLLEERYSKTVWIENDGKCFALAEYWKGNLSDVKNGVVITLGTGVGGGIILNGELYRGINLSSGEFSSMLDNFENPFQANRFSDIGGHRSLTDLYVKMKDNQMDIDGREFFEKYHDGDEIAIKALNDYSKIIAAGIFNIQTILDVEKFCLGGGISSQDVLIKEIKESLHDIFLTGRFKAINEPKIKKCYYNNAAGCVGALYNYLLMEEII